MRTPQLDPRHLHQIVGIGLCLLVVSPVLAERKTAGHAIRIGTHAAPTDTISVGKPNDGALGHGVQLQNSDLYVVRARKNYGTRELVQTLENAAQAVHDAHPNSPKLYAGDLSYEHGGPIGRHISHQSGRDADVAYYMTKGHDENRLKTATVETLDVPRTWTYVKSLLMSGETQIIFSHRPLIKLLFEEAQRDASVSDEQRTRWFSQSPGTKTARAKLRHLDGHHHHLHIRVYARGSQGSLADIDDPQERALAKDALPGDKEPAVASHGHHHDDYAGERVPDDHDVTPCGYTFAAVSEPAPKVRQSKRRRRARTRAHQVASEARSRAQAARLRLKLRQMGLDLPPK